jgi:Ca2+-binding RTX toxin-like protein
MTAIGIYGDNDPGRVTAFENWLGRSVDQVLVSLNQSSWPDFEGSILFETSLWSHTGHSIMWSVPLIVNGASLDQAATGAYDSYWLDAARAIAATPGNDPIIIRTGWEFNLPGGQPWADAGHEAAYVASFQHFVDEFRSVSGRFRFDWNFNIGQNDPSPSYPGDNYVDTISIDDYYNQAWDSTDPVQAFNYNVSRPNGLQFLQDFATAHHKPVAFSEWGVQNDNAGPYINLMSKWFADHNVLYQNYWNSNSGFAGRLDDGSKPDAATAFRADFGPPLPPPSPPPDPTPGITVYGNDGPNTLYGSAGNDTLFGFGADDVIFGQDGNDEIHGGAGNDHLYGQSGNDTIYAEGGDDQVFGGAGSDYLYGQDGNDIIFAEDGDDEIYGGAGNDTLYGQAGNDKIYGEDGNNILMGGDGNDLLVGGIGNDIVNGENGDDTLVGGPGNDILTGGAGKDTFVFGPGSGADQITDFEPGIDHIDLTGYHLAANSLQVKDIDNNHDVLVTLSASDNIVLTGVHANQLHLSTDFIL